MKIRIKKMRENAKLPEFKGGNWIDTYVSKIGFISNAIGEFDFDNIIYPTDTELFKNLESEGSDDMLLGYGGCRYDTNNTLQYSMGDIIILKLGFALELPKGKELHLLSRSGTFRKYGLILTNGMGIGDDTYIGDNDEYMAMMYATRAGSVSLDDRLIQIKIEDAMPKVEFEEVEMFGNTDIGGYGSTGR